MAWSEADRTLLEEAIRKLVAGERKVSVTFVNRAESYQQLDLATALKLRKEMNDEVQPGRPRIFRTSYTKGL